MGPRHTCRSHASAAVRPSSGHTARPLLRAPAQRAGAPGGPVCRLLPFLGTGRGALVGEQISSPSGRRGALLSAGKTTGVPQAFTRTVRHSVSRAQLSGSRSLAAHFLQAHRSGSVRHLLGAPPCRSLDPLPTPAAALLRRSVLPTRAPQHHLPGCTPSWRSRQALGVSQKH